MKITVTQEHIDAGQRKSNESCPIANALKGKGLSDPLVYDTFICVESNINYTLPPSARDFVDRFDNLREVKPFTFVARRVIP